MDEIFEIFDRQGRLLGTALRSQAHRQGLWHKAVNVFLCDAANRLWLQRRSLTKDVCGGAWDLTVAEHLKPGETYLAAAERGLAEELGVTGVTLERLGDVVACELDIPGVKDYEHQQTFFGTYDGPFTLNPAEVDAVRALTLERLAAEVSQSPNEFTPWIVRRIAELAQRLDAQASARLRR